MEQIKHVKQPDTRLDALQGFCSGPISPQHFLSAFSGHLPPGAGRGWCLMTSSIQRESLELQLTGLK